MKYFLIEEDVWHPCMIYYYLYFILENTFWGFRVLHSGNRAGRSSQTKFIFFYSHVSYMCANTVGTCFV